MKKTLAYLIVAACIVTMLSNCTVSMSSEGKPVIGVDPVAIAQTIAIWQAKHGAKDSVVVIVAPDGKTATTIPKPTAQDIEVTNEVKKLNN